MAKVKGDIVIDIEKCKGCELCASACPQQSLELTRKLNSKGYHYIVKIEDNCTITNVTGDITVNLNS